MQPTASKVGFLSLKYELAVKGATTPENKADIRPALALSAEHLVASHIVRDILQSLSVTLEVRNIQIIAHQIHHSLQWSVTFLGYLLKGQYADSKHKQRQDVSPGTCSSLPTGVLPSVDLIVAAIPD